MTNEEILKGLSGVFYLATSEDSQPHVRPFDKAAEVNGKIYIATSANKRVFQQILENPKIEIFALGDFGVTRFMAEAYEEDDEKIIKEAYAKMEKDFSEDKVALRLERIRKA